MAVSSNILVEELACMWTRDKYFFTWYKRRVCLKNKFSPIFFYGVFFSVHEIT